MIPYLSVDFNKGLSYGLYYYAKADLMFDINGDDVALTEGMPFYAWDGDSDDEGNNIIVADAVLRLNTLADGSNWDFTHLKWVCEVDTDSWRHEKKDYSKWSERVIALSKTPTRNTPAHPEMLIEG